MIGQRIDCNKVSLPSVVAPSNYERAIDTTTSPEVVNHHRPWRFQGAKRPIYRPPMLVQVARANRHRTALEDIATHVPLTWPRILLCLFVPPLLHRCPAEWQRLRPDSLSTRLDSLFGPYSYRIAKIHRNKTSGSLRPHVRLEANIGFLYGLDDTESAMSSVGVRPYKFDTTSVGLRTIVNHLDPPSWNPCLAYAKACRFWTRWMCVCDGRCVDDNDGVTSAYSVEHILVKHLHQFLMAGIFPAKQWRIVQGHFFHNPAQGYICHAVASQLCIKLLPPTRAKAQGYAQQPNQTLQLAIVKSTLAYIHDTGGIADTSNKDYDIVTLFRVQTCDDGPCTNDTIEDSVSKVPSLIPTASRGTVPFVCCALLVKCITFLLAIGYYVAVRDHRAYMHASVSTTAYAALKLALRIPSQVVVYGSWLSVVLFVVAMQSTRPSNIASFNTAGLPF
ncbi:Aste57867_14217 [Aphanomyces stellatus]|uniref:Aste57867_14217 protein n=1 Tax=Aphanomyces stellatus TaxID=120398 RepID=A0A485L0Y6_9STRA|nr:hypothetical protein As57867_014166 [Aphanomyces stellatus]VFT91042.1 Aste57867_14217 [Aphanomyces stellatus]